MIYELLRNPLNWLDKNLYTIVETLVMVYVKGVFGNVGRAVKKVAYVPLSYDTIYLDQFMSWLTVWKNSS